MDKATAKLIEVVASGIGAVAAPWVIRRNAYALADRARLEAQAERDAREILEGAKVLSEDGELVKAQSFQEAHLISEAAEINSRTSFQETKRQRNLRAITEQAVEQLDESVSDENLDPDWIARFFSYAQDVTRQEMQALWGRLLAGEVARPGSYSLSTLEVIRNMSQVDAQDFHRLAAFFVADAVYQKSQKLASEGFSLDKLHGLEELGLIRTSFGLIKQFHNRSGEGFATTIPLIIRRGWALHVGGRKAVPFVTLDSYLLTRAGREIALSLEDVELNLDYLHEVAAIWGNEGYEVVLLRPEGSSRLA